MRAAPAPDAGPEEDALRVQNRWEQLERILTPGPLVSVRFLRTEAPLTLRDAVSPFLRWLLAVRGRSRLTALYYGESLRAFIDFCERFGLEAARDVEESHIETFLAAETGRGLKGQSVVRHLYAFRSFFKYLLRERVIDRDPAVSSFGPTVVKGLPRYLTRPEWTRVLRKLGDDRSLRGQRDRAIIATFLYAGLRCAELATLRLDQVSLDARTLRVRGKGQRERELPLVEALVPILRAYLATVRPELVAGPDNPFVFTTSERGWECRPGRWTRGLTRPGSPLLTRTLYAIVVARVGGILGRHVHPHMLRHSFASRLRQAGGDLQLVQELLGHAEIGTTMTYSHLNTATRAREVNKLLGRPRMEAVGRARRADAVIGTHRAVGDRLRDARHRAALTRAQLAQAAQVGTTTLARLEVGRMLPSAGTLRRITEATGVSADWLLTGTEAES